MPQGCGDVPHTMGLPPERVWVPQSHRACGSWSGCRCRRQPRCSRVSRGPGESWPLQCGGAGVLHARGVWALHVFWGVLGARLSAGIFVPSCDEDGYYRRAQCEPGGAQCWCVDPQHGTELSGTRSHGHPDCGELGGTVG